MRRLLKPIIIFLLFLTSLNCQRNAETKPFYSYWKLLPDRYWIGPEYWANRLQDWHLKNGRIECINAIQPKRTLHILTRYISNRPGSLHMKINTGLIKKSSGATESSWSGFLLGAGSESMDYRRRALIHGTSGQGGGLISAVNELGGIIIIDNESGEQWYSANPYWQPGAKIPESFSLSLELIPKGDQYRLIISTSDTEKNEEILRLDTMILRKGNFGGNMALICNGGS